MNFLLHHRHRHERLRERRTIQKVYEVTVLEAIYHVVEHFSMHTGQIIFATKLLTGEDLGFYAPAVQKLAHKSKGHGWTRINTDDTFPDHGRLKIR